MTLWYRRVAAYYGERRGERSGGGAVRAAEAAVVQGRRGERSGGAAAPADAPRGRPARYGPDAGQRPALPAYVHLSRPCGSRRTPTG